MRAVKFGTLTGKKPKTIFFGFRLNPKIQKKMIPKETRRKIIAEAKSAMTDKTRIRSIDEILTKEIPEEQKTKELFKYLHRLELAQWNDPDRLSGDVHDEDRQMLDHAFKQALESPDFRDKLLGHAMTIAIEIHE